MLVSGPAVGAAQILFWSYTLCSCLQCPQLSELVCFLLWELSMAFYIFHRYIVCLIDCVDFICSLYSWWEGFESSALPTLPLVSIWVLFPPLHVDYPLGLLLRLPWRTWVCPCEGQVWRWCSYFSHRGSGSTRYSGELVARVAGNIAL